jgi:hypothetical protein
MRICLCHSSEQRERYATAGPCTFDEHMLPLRRAGHTGLMCRS